MTESKWKNVFMPGTMEMETSNAKRYFNLDIWHYLIIIGIAASGLAAFVATYDAVSDINKNIQACINSGDLQSELNTKFIVVMALSAFSIVLGVVMAWILRNQKIKVD
jgi:F0F1-type ATP synthase membrane subunit c/vacuolar-type H+-ATPase subunit K